MIRDLADEGKAVIVISSEYAELLAVSDRVLILRDGTRRSRSWPAATSPTKNPSNSPSKESNHDPDHQTPRDQRRRRAAAERRSWFATLDWRRYVIYIGFVVVFLFFAVLLGDQGFLSANNLLNILRQTATITVIAVGMTYVIACAEIDLSVGSVAGLASVVTAMAVANYGVVAGVLAGLAGRRRGRLHQRRSGRLLEHPVLPGHARHARHRGRHGAVDHRLRAAADPVRRLQPGLRLRQYRAHPRACGLDGDLRRRRRVVLAKTRFGRQVLATGGNRMAAEFTGINTKRIKFQVLLISGVVAALRRHALRGPAAVRPLPVGSRRRTVRHRGGDPGRHQPLRRRRRRWSAPSSAPC